MAREESTARYAVENTNLDTGETVRYLETAQEFVAQVFVDRANAAFAKRNVNAVSKWVKIHD